MDKPRTFIMTLPEFEAGRIVKKTHHVCFLADFEAIKADRDRLLKVLKNQCFCKHVDFICDFCEELASRGPKGDGDAR